VSAALHSIFEGSGAGHEADLTVGDCWGIDATHICYNKNGVSVALVGKPKGKQLFA